MRRLSISKAWDETKAIVARDGRLFVSVALALVALPTIITTLVNPAGMSSKSPPWIDILMLLFSLAGQLALIRLALGPSVTVGGAVRHGFTRMPIYLLAAIIIFAGLCLLAVPLAFALSAMGVPLNATALQLTPAAALLLLIYFAVVCFFAVRLVLAAPVASAEQVGPIRIIQRAWTLSAGHWWQIFGFVVMFFIGAGVLFIAIGSAVGLAVSVTLGPIQPLSVSALIVALVQALINAVITILFAVMLARMYVQLAGRGEAHASVPSSGT